MFKPAVISLSENIRWVLDFDLDRLVEIERSSFVHPWDKCDFIRAKRHKDNVLLVCDMDEEGVLGYILYNYDRKRFLVLRMAVAPGVRRRGIGSRLATCMKFKSDYTGKSVYIYVYDDELWVHQFLRSCGFVCKEVQRRNSTPDVYGFVYASEQQVIRRMIR
jgi:ribosomal-protein-alanine N-acetyltransferase